MNVIISAARDMLGDGDAAGSEYERATVEMTCRLLSVSTENRDAVRQIIYGE